MKAAERLKNQYIKDLTRLQNKCAHKETHWATEEFAPAHGTGWEVLSCDNCWKIIKRRTTCYCGKEILMNQEEFDGLPFTNYRVRGSCNENCYNKMMDYITMKETK